MWRLFLAHINPTISTTSVGLRTAASRESTYTTPSNSGRTAAVAAAIMASSTYSIFSGYTAANSGDSNSEREKRTNASCAIKEERQSTLFDTSVIQSKLSLGSYKPAAFVHCEPPSQNGQSAPPKKTSSPEDVNVTFRQRRLTMNKPNIREQGEELETGETATQKQTASTSVRSGTLKKRSSVLYSSEMDEREEAYSYSVPMNSEEGHPSDLENLSNQNMHPPFPSHIVGTYSCHGIEPHPYAIYVVPDEEDVEETVLKKSPTNSFLSRVFGTYSTPQYTSSSNRSKKKKKKHAGQTRIITVTEKKINQDRGMVIYPYGNSSGCSKRSTQRTALFGAYDGHGEQGEYLAEYTMHALCEKLCLHPAYSKKEIDTSVVAAAFLDTFRTIDEELSEVDLLNPVHSGSTACVVLLQDMKVWVANVGDSRAVLARKGDSCEGINLNDNVAVTPQGLYVIELTKDQNACDEKEKERILKSGGFVTPPQGEGLPARIWLDEQCTQIGLAMSRSIGDHALKGVGVIVDPVVQEYELTENDQFFIIATDGVWEFISSAEAVSIIQSCFEKGLGASDACKELIRIAMDKWKEKEGDYRDDITAIVVRVDGLWGDEEDKSSVD